MMLSDKRILDSLGWKVWLLFLLISLGSQVVGASHSWKPQAQRQTRAQQRVPVKSAKAPSIDTRKAASSHWSLPPVYPPMRRIAKLSRIKLDRTPENSCCTLCRVEAQIFING